MSGVIPEKVNEEQRRAIEHGDGPLLIVAGAGTGKTTVITQRIAWLILEKKVPIDGVLALTFTDKAATEMEERVDRLLPYGYVNLWVSTFHAFSERMLREHAVDIGLAPDFRLLPPTEQWLLVRKNFERFELDYYRPLGNPTRFISALLKHFSRLEDEDITAQAYLEYARSLKLNRDDETFSKQRGVGDEAESEHKRIEEVARAYATYRQLLLDDGSLDFGMLITYTRELLQKRPAILEHYRKLFQYILVDEFQDTNWAQYELIKLLAAPRNNLTVVGDDDQSIYKFRGASLSNILEFRKDFPNCQQVVLTKNYRSRQNILNLAYHFIQLNNPYRLEAALTTGKRSSGSQKKASGRRTNARQTSAVTKKLHAVSPEEGRIEFIHAPSEEQETRGVVEKIIELHHKEKLAWNEFAVLVRANDQAESFAHEFELQGTPYQFMAAKGLYRKPDVLDLVSYLRLLDNYHESAALHRILMVPGFKIAAEDTVELGAYAKRKGISLYHALVQSRAVPNINPRSRKGIDEVLRLIQHGSMYARTHKVTEVLYEFLKASGILHDLGRQHTPNAFERVSAIRKYLEELGAFEKVYPHATVREFLEWFSFKLESGDAGSLVGTYEADVDAVRIMTVHGAKGLEFSHVFIPQLVDRRFPTTERKDPIEIPLAVVREILPEGDVHVQEERRLLYVAMTRAKKGLFLSAAQDYGGMRAKHPSRFLYELGFIQREPQRRLQGIAQLERPQPVEHRRDELRYLGSKYSFSAMRSYEKCPWQFRYAYVLKVPVTGTGLQSFGESMHRTLQKFFELVRDRTQSRQASLLSPSGQLDASGSVSQNPTILASSGQSLPVSLDELMSLYNEEFVEDWYESERQRQEFRERGRASLKSFYEKHERSFPEVLALEQPFNLKLDRYTVSGMIDRVDVLGRDDVPQRMRVGIVDYKSGRSRDMDRADRYQLFIYALAAQDPNILNAQVANLSYYFLDDNQEVKIAVDEEELHKTEAWIRSTIEKIQSGNFAATPGMVCRYCDYNEICEFRDPNY